MQILKQLVQKSIEKFQEGKLNGKDHVELYYFAYGISYAFLKLNNKIQIDEIQFELRNAIFRSLYDELVKKSASGSPSEIKQRYEKISERLRKDFQAIRDADSSIIAKFLDEAANIQIGEESYGSVLFKDDMIGMIESNYPG